MGPVKTPSICVILFLLLLSTSVLGAQPVDIFINSDPINAIIVLDGTVYHNKTPALIRAVEPGKHVVELYKNDTYPQKKVIHVSADDSKNYLFPLESKYVYPAFIPEEEVGITSFDEGKDYTIYKIPEGMYKLGKNGNELTIDALYPNENLRTISHFVMPFLFSAFTIINNVNYVQSNNDENYYNAVLLTTNVLTYGFFSYNNHLNEEKKEYVENFKLLEANPAESPKYAEENYQAAEQLLTRGKLQEALILYSRITDNYSDTFYFPYAYYRIAKIHFLTGNDEFALLEFELLVDIYQVNDLYDKSVKGIIDILEQQQKYEEAISWFNEFVYIDPLVSREDILVQKCRIREKQYVNDPGYVDEVITCYNDLTRQFPESQQTETWKEKEEYYESLVD